MYPSKWCTCVAHKLFDDWEIWFVVETVSLLKTHVAYYRSSVQFIVETRGFNVEMYMAYYRSLVRFIVETRGFIVETHIAYYRSLV